jgi:diacylglycerol kinase (ATP)
MPRRALFLANRKSRRGEELAEDATRRLRELGWECVSPTVDSRDDAPRQIVAHAADVERVIIAGGDGSVNAALPGIMQTRLPVGLIPAGTANDLARTLDLPTDLAPAVEVAAADKLKPIDLATVNDIPFVNAASIGLSVAITRELSRPLKKRWGPFAYVIAACRATWKARAYHAVIHSHADDVALRTVQIVVGNGRYFGTGMAVDEVARIDDGVLHLYSVGVYHWWSILALAPSLRRGTTRSHRDVYNADGQSFTVETLRPKTVSADGELLTQTPATFKLHREAMRIAVR